MALLARGDFICNVILQIGRSVVPLEIPRPWEGHSRSAPDRGIQQDPWECLLHWEDQWSPGGGANSPGIRRGLIRDEWRRRDNDRNSPGHAWSGQCAELVPILDTLSLLPSPCFYLKVKKTLRNVSKCKGGVYYCRLVQDLDPAARTAECYESLHAGVSRDKGSLASGKYRVYVRKSTSM